MARRFRLAFWRKPRVNVVELHGLIASGPGLLNLAGAAPLIDKAFDTARGQPVILHIESPGGSPVQSDLIAAHIRRRAEKAKIEVHAVIGDTGASGGYWIACAADQIHANLMSIVGSIGVRGGGFGFDRLIARFGIDRRLYTAGGKQGAARPLLPERPEDVAFTQKLLDDLHVRFKAWVRERRGARLTADDAAIFDGSFMLGDQARALGLIDGFADVESLVRTLAGDKAKPNVLRPRRRGLLRMLPRMAAGAMLDALEERRAHVLLFVT